MYLLLQSALTLIIIIINKLISIQHLIINNHTNKRLNCQQFCQSSFHKTSRYFHVAFGSPKRKTNKRLIPNKNDTSYLSPNALFESLITPIASTAAMASRISPLSLIPTSPRRSSAYVTTTRRDPTKSGVTAPLHVHPPWFHGKSSFDLHPDDTIDRQTGDEVGQMHPMHLFGRLEIERNGLLLYFYY